MINKMKIMAVVAIILFYLAVITFYSEILLNGDAGYAYLHMREILLGHHFDFLYKSVSYCGVIELFFSALYSMLLPVKAALPLGMLTYYAIGFFLLRKNYPVGSRFGLLLILFLPLPNPFYQSFAALSGHTFSLFTFFILAHFLSRPQYRNADGGWKWSALICIGFASGFGVYGYQLSKLAAYPCLLVLCIFELSAFFWKLKKQIFMSPPYLKSWGTLASKIAVVWFSFRVGLLPRKISMAYFGSEHLMSGGPKVNLHMNHWFEKGKTFQDVLSRIFTPIWEHHWVKVGNFTHFNYPIHDVITQSSSVSFWIGVIVIGGFTVGAAVVLVKQFLIPRMSKPYLLQIDAYLLYLFGSTLTFLLGYFVRSDFDANTIHESRYLLTLYFAPLMGLLYLMPRFQTIIGLISTVALLSHFTVIQANFRNLSQIKSEKSCESLAQSQVYEVLKRIEPNALAGSYWEVWSSAAYLNQAHVYDFRHDRFHFNHTETLRRKLVIIVPSVDYLATDEAKLHFEKLKGRQFESTHLGPYLFFFEKDIVKAPHGWAAVIDPIVADYGKSHCNFSSAT